MSSVPRRPRLWLAVLAGLILGVGLAVAASQAASTPHGDCKNENAGNHNGYTCDAGGGGGGGNGSGNGNPGATPPGGGDCKNDNAGNHNGYTCPPDDNTGQEPGPGPGPTPGPGPSGGGPTGSSTSTSAASTAGPANTPGEQAEIAVLDERVRACASRRSFVIHIQRHNGVRFRSAKITFRGKVLASRRGNRRVMAPIVLKRLPRGTFRVHIRVVTVTGHVIKGTRTYHTCTKKRPAHRPPRL